MVNVASMQENYEKYDDPPNMSRLNVVPVEPDAPVFFVEQKTVQNIKKTGHSLASPRLIVDLPPSLCLMPSGCKTLLTRLPVVHA